MMTPRVTVSEDTRAALQNAFKMHAYSTELGRSLALPTSGLHLLIGVQFGTLMRAINGRLVPAEAAHKMDLWYEHAGRFLPAIEG